MLWRVSQILHESPFSPAVLGLTQAQLEFILVNYAQDHPLELRFIPQRLIEEKMAEQTANTGWANVLIGKALAAFQSMKSFAIPARFTQRGTMTQNPAALIPPRVPPVQRPSVRRR